MSTTQDTIPGKSVQIKNGKCWSHRGRYLGELIKFSYGSVYLWSTKDSEHLPYEIYTFKNGSVEGLDLKFTEVFL